MKKITLILSLLVFISFTSCEELFNLAEESQLSNEEIVEGLKTALEVGTDTSVTVTSALNGYYKDEVIKILLPPEAEDIQNTIDQIPRGRDMLDTFVLSINRAAEDAANEARPILKDAVTGMSITDGISILNGINPAAEDKKSVMEFDSTAATSYLRSTTYDQLYNAYQPKIQNSLDKKLVENISTNGAWTALTTGYNYYVALLDPSKEQINTELDDYATTKALDGLLYKVGQEEIKIRRDPFQWALDILHKVFGGN